MKTLFQVSSGVKRRIARTVSAQAKKTLWYKSLFVDPDHKRYPDNVWYRANDARNFDIVNLGSFGGRWAFDYASFTIKGMNWANQPQTLVDDLRLFKNFHSILRKGGTVVIVIMPFTSLNKRTGVMDTLKYCGTMDWTLLDPAFRDAANSIRQNPFNHFKRRSIRAMIEHLSGFERPPAPPRGSMDETNPLSPKELDNDAQWFMDGWARQFGIEDFEASLTEENKKGREIRIGVMRELVDFSVERGYRPVWVLPPVTRHLGKFFTQKFREIYIDGFLREVNRDVQFLDYLSDGDLQDDNLYFNSFFLNANGRRVFTERVLKDIGIVHHSSNKQ